MMNKQETWDLIDIKDELEQIQHVMAEKVLAKLEQFIAENGYDESEG